MPGEAPELCRRRRAQSSGCIALKHFGGLVGVRLFLRLWSLYGFALFFFRMESWAQLYTSFPVCTIGLGVGDAIAATGLCSGWYERSRETLSVTGVNEAVMPN